MKIITYNVNGIRSAISKGFIPWLQSVNADCICLQEIKADSFESKIFEEMGYQVFWHPAAKKGYSGVAILSKVNPVKVGIGCGLHEIDNEGRIIRADYENFSLVNVYVPSGSSGLQRHFFKQEYLAFFKDFIQNLLKEKKELIVCGDINICHQPIDIHNPKANSGTSGFLPEEREWLSGFLELGFQDAFRIFNKEPHHYTWWSYRAGARKKNLGWRLDYHFVSELLKDRIRRTVILKDASHSDHCPVLLEMM